MNFRLPFRRNRNTPKPQRFGESLAWSRSIHQHQRGAVFPAKCRLATVAAAAARADLAPFGAHARLTDRRSVDGRRDQVVAVHGTRLYPRVETAAAIRTNP